MSEELLKQAVQKIAKLLSFRSHSEKELKQKLSKKFSKEIIEQALDEAKQKNWLEPALELSQKIKEQLNKKNKSWFYIKSYLKEKELPLLAYSKKDEIKKTVNLLKKLMRDNPKKTKIQMRRFLANRFFETDVIEEALSGLDFENNL